MISWWSEEVPFISTFDGNHIVYITIVVGLMAALFRYRKQVKVNAKKIGIIILITSILQQTLLYSWYVLEMGFDVSESLPLHISRVTSLLGIFYLFTKNKKVMDVVFFFSLFAYASFLYPQRIYPITHVIGISYLVNHAITILLPYFAYIAHDWRPNRKSLIHAYSFFLIYFWFVYFLNPFIDGNYFYLKYRPFFHEWPDYIYVPVVLIVVFFGFLLAYQVVKWISLRGTKMENKRVRVIDGE